MSAAQKCHQRPFAPHNSSTKPKQRRRKTPCQALNKKFLPITSAPSQSKSCVNQWWHAGACASKDTLSFSGLREDEDSAQSPRRQGRLEILFLTPSFKSKSMHGGRNITPDRIQTLSTPPSTTKSTRRRSSATWPWAPRKRKDLAFDSCSHRLLRYILQIHTKHCI